MKLKIGITIIMLACFAFYYRWDYYRHTEPPPGWTIVCDGKGHYGARFPDDIIDGKSFHSYTIPDHLGRLMTSRQQAINRAWDQEDFMPHTPPHSGIRWHDCP